jgi:hypothetical protein
MKSLFSFLATLVVLNNMQPAYSHNATGTIKCFGASSRQSSRNEKIISTFFKEHSDGYSILIVGESSQSVMILDKRNVIKSAGTLEGDSIIPWNIHFYDKTPMKLESNGKYSIVGMAVSTRSYCSFSGIGQYLK